MAERRMFAMTIIDSDAFLDMPLSTQALYFHLSMRADDDGFLNNPKKIQRVIGASDDDLVRLVAKRFIIAFTSGVVVIKHWNIHNYIKKDRYKPTVYTSEKQQLTLKSNNSYTESTPNGTNLEPVCIQNVSLLDTQVRLELGKVSLGKVSNTSPELEENTSTVETAASPKLPPSPIFIELPAIGSPGKPEKLHKVTQDDLATYVKTYPAVDVKQELMQMSMWLQANPTRKKSNTKAFIINWLKKSQDRSVGGGGQPIRYHDDKPRMAQSALRPNSSRGPIDPDGKPIVTDFTL